MFLALRELRFAKTRYALIAAIMLLVSFLVLFVTGLARGLASDNASAVERMDASHFVLQQGSEHRFARSELSDADRRKVEQAGASEATPIGIRQFTVTHGGGDAKLDVTMLGVDPDGWLAPRTAAGAALAAGGGEVVADAGLQAQGLGIGSVVKDEASGRSWTIAGFVEGASFSHTPALYMTLADWQSWRGGEPAYTAIALRGASSETLQALKRDSAFELLTKAQAVSAIPGYKEEQGSLLMMIVFLFAISGLVLSVFFYVITLQKTAQFGVLKAIGARSGYLARSVKLQVLLLSVSSYAVSTGLVALMQLVLPDSMPFRLTAQTYGLTGLLFVAMAMAGSLLSVLKVARSDALQAIGGAAA
ncbi:ABC transporter permease [Cohnella sp. 56]|uniref:ABC transporter permease n=1 Tax=Cohnella sp. 56 TaxID=3113722 RepID=UPI0030E8151E